MNRGSHKYRSAMDILISALSVCHMNTLEVTDEKLTKMLKTIAVADAAGFIFVKPLDLKMTMEKLELQKKAIGLVQGIREFSDEYRNYVRKEQMNEAAAKELGG